MSDLVERLRSRATAKESGLGSDFGDDAAAFRKAADRIEELERELKESENYLNWAVDRAVAAEASVAALVEAAQIIVVQDTGDVWSDDHGWVYPIKPEAVNMLKTALATHGARVKALLAVVEAARELHATTRGEGNDMFVNPEWYAIAHWLKLRRALAALDATSEKS